MLAHWEERSAYAWPILLRENDLLVGMIEARVDAAMVNISYVIARAHWNKGFATERSGRSVRGPTRSPTFFVSGPCARSTTRPPLGCWRRRDDPRANSPAVGVFPNINGAPRDCYSYSLARESALQAAP